jgi:ankyrin repeat protein
MILKRKLLASMEGNIRNYMGKRICYNPHTMENIIEAAMNGDHQAVKKFLDSGVDPNFHEDWANVTALHIAAQADDVELADILLRAGADICVQTFEGSTPLQTAFLNGSQQMALLLAVYLEHKLMHDDKASKKVASSLKNSNSAREILVTE